MNETKDTTAAVARQYEQFPYPAAATRSLDPIDAGDPSVDEVLLWPEGRPRANLDILIAGCGTRQAARIAHKNPNCRVLAIDISETSIGLSRQVSAHLSNIEFQLCDLRSLPKDRTFDLIFCTGVLHHLDDPDEGLRSLGAALTPDGAINIMLYAKHGRHGVYLMQDVVRRLGLKPDEEGLKLARQLINGLPGNHPFRSFAKSVGDLATDAALVDTLFHPKDRAYSVPEIFSLVENAGLEFQCWYDNFRYFPEGSINPSSGFWQAIRKLPDAAQAAVMDNIFTGGVKHTFIARRNASPISFSGSAWRDYVVKGIRPVETVRIAGTTPGEFKRGPATFSMTMAEVVLLKLCDGNRSISEAMKDKAFAAISPQELERGARDFFERMWKSGHIYISVARAR